jgi:anti-sigma-K factor RskA
MSPSSHDDDNRLEAYFDGLLEGPERAAMEEELRANPLLAQQVELQSQIDSRLAHLFHVEAPANGTLVARMLQQRSQVVATKRGWRPAMIAAALAAAASLAWVVAGMPLPRGRVEEPYFAARPLADLYHETIKQGFEPEYECREADRFADTFARRQGVALKLLPLADGAQMLGLSYPGGLSRHTTAMLCQVEGKPVMVFVDQASKDLPLAAEHADAQTHVFRQERDGLVFYEVSPLDRPHVTAAMVPAS